MKYAIGILWLVAALALQKQPAAHRFFAYGGTIVTLVHACALVGGLLYQRLFDARSVEGGVSLAGFLIGILAGVGLGAWAGSAVSQNIAAYWIAQIAAAAFLIFLPLFPT
jgi:hypothetical protein